ncbi:efflux RND transporter periplasmic adaptor subunit [Shimia aestuarii]|uniref:RND family efflux transporter, MFP subunit n=1 Tax=Shimia aestuarii TaxID=254406 RepID=A0A1I4ST55_9RHOB|nr:efflux RND transporter periplasmic adaptor subunit [Shimia aestuarii]SFM67601.1 RND family efflux transporter, MFP subunit [Shimia aestuarii]
MKALKVMSMLALLSAAWPFHAVAETSRIAEVPEWKAVFARIETRDRVPARSRLGGTLDEIKVSEGDTVQKDDIIGLVKDEKLRLQMEAIDSQARSLASQLENAQSELARGENLLKQGVTTAQRVDGLRTEVEVLQGRIDTVGAERDVLLQRIAEGAVLAPMTGRVLQVPVTAGSVIMPGEPVAVIGGGGFFLRLAVPERHAGTLKQGDQILIGSDGSELRGTLAKIYPLIENGRMIADVDVPELDTDFVDARVLVRLPVGSNSAVVVPLNAVHSRMGLDFVTIRTSGGEPIERTVVVGETHLLDGATVIEILSGLGPDETLVIGHE